MGEHGFVTVHTEIAPESAGGFAIEREVIEGAGGTVRFARATTEDERIALLQEADAVLVAGAPITRRVIEACPRLKLVIRYGVGLDTLDIPAATDHGVVVAHYPDFCQPEVANHATMLLLAVARKLVPHDRAVREGRWRGVPLGPTPAIGGETCGVVAFGNIARHFSVRAQALGMHVIAYDPYVDDAVFRAASVERVGTLEELLERSDFVSVHAPLTPETRHMFGREQFARMKPSAILVNTARGPIVDIDALVEALEAGQIAGAGLDVFEPEPLPEGHPLTRLDNVALTPHSAFYSDRASDAMKQRVGQTVVSVMNGLWPDDIAALPNREQLKETRAHLP